LGLELGLTSAMKVDTGIWFRSHCVIIATFRDVFLESDCDAGCLKLAGHLGWAVS